MEGYEDVEGEEEVDYDFNLDDEFFNEGLEGEEKSSPAENSGDVGSTTPQVAVSQAANPSTHRNGAVTTAIMEKNNSEPEMAAVAEDPGAKSGRQKIPIPVPKPSGEQKSEPNNAAEHAKFSKPTKDARAASPAAVAGGRQVGGRQAERRSRRGPPSFPRDRPAPGPGPGPGQRLGDRPHPGMKPQNGMGLPLLFNQGPGHRPQRSASGAPMLPMPPGLLPLPGLNNVYLPRPEMRHPQGGPAWHLPNRNIPLGPPARGQPQLNGPTSIAHQFPGRDSALEQFAPSGAARGGLPLRGNSSPSRAREAIGADKKRVWDRLGPAPRLAGDFEDDNEDFQPPRKRSSPDVAAPPRARPREPARMDARRASGPTGGLPMPAMPPPRDPIAEAAEAAKQEAQTQRLANIQKQIEAQKLENALIQKMNELKKKEQIAALQDQIAKLEAAEQRRQSAASAKAAAATPQPVAKPSRAAAAEEAAAERAGPKPTRRLAEEARPKVERATKAKRASPEEDLSPPPKRPAMAKEANAKAPRRETTRHAQARREGSEGRDAGEHGGRDPWDRQGRDLREFISKQRERKQGQPEIDDLPRRRPAHREALSRR